MIVELAKHIETLLLENDCVIIPDFGGFIVHNVSARRDEQAKTFLPPHRALAFNPQLNLNDGLLIQSYMAAYDLNYPEAQQRVENAVEELRDRLEEESFVELHGVGRLSLDIEDKFVFSPCESGLLSPSLYGFTAFRMDLLPEDAPISLKPETAETEEERKRKRNMLVLHIDRRWLNNAVAVVIAFVLFYVLSVPVGNTYVEPENYASVGNVELFSQIRSQSVATTIIPENKTVVKSNRPKEVASATATPAVTTQATSATVQADAQAIPTAKANTQAATATIAVPEAPKVTAPKAVTAQAEKEAESAAIAAPAVKKARYHIIIASVTNDEEAQKTIEYFASKGYPGATAVKADGRVRIALGSYSDRQEADARWNEVRNIELLKNAWICATRN